METQHTPVRRIGIAGLGAIGRELAARLQTGVAGYTLSAVAVRDPSKPLGIQWREPVPVVTTIDQLEAHCDIVVECAPAALLPDIATPMLKAGKSVVVLSSSALLTHPELVGLARTHGGSLLVPSGAILGLDALLAAAEGTIHSVTMISRKPVGGLEGAPYLAQHGISLEGITAPTCVFLGTAREAAAGFPANLNVAVNVSMAGIGPDRTQLEFWADPSLDRNVHRIEVDSDSARLSLEIQNIPSANPRTGRITVQSVIALLRKQAAALRVGT